MPANLPPEYHAAEKVYRAARTAEEKIEALRRMLAIMPHHKGTDKLQADLRQRIAKLQDQAERAQASGRKGPRYTIPKEGLRQLVMVGCANSGKSQLLSELTEARPRVADYPFATQQPVPGVMRYQDVAFQLVDMPSFHLPEAEPWFRAVPRAADLLLLVVDLEADAAAQLEDILQELGRLGLRPVAKPPPDHHAEHPQPKQALVVAAKLDADGAEEALGRLREKNPGLRLVPVTALDEETLDGLRRAVFEELRVVRVYTKAPGEPPEMDQPVLLPAGSTVIDVAESVHKDLRRNFKYALIWGSGKFDGQRVPRDYQVADRDVVEVHAEP